MTDVFRTMIVTAADAPLARTLAAGLSPGGVGMFVVGLSPTGKAPATHYISTGHIAEPFAACIVSGESLHAACTAAGAAVDRATCDGLVQRSDVSDGTRFDPESEALIGESPFDAMARLGLQRIP